MKKRNLFQELVEGFDALEADRKDKVCIKKMRIELLPTPRKVVASAMRKRNQVH